MAASPHPVPADVAAALACVAERRGSLGTRVVWFPEITSTNDVAAVLAAEGAEEGCLVAADVQTAGRGRRGHGWSSPAGAGIYASVILRPASAVAPLLTIAAGVAIAEGITRAAALDTWLKWPNDVCAGCAGGPPPGGRKLAGILAEAGASPEGQPHVVLGFGINVVAAAHPPDVARRATSIESERGSTPDRALVLAECLAALWQRYRQLQDGRVDIITNAWRVRAGRTFGRPVQWESGGMIHCGLVETIDADGGLLVRTGAGVTRVISGEVTWL